MRNLPKKRKKIRTQVQLIKSKKQKPMRLKSQKNKIMLKQKENKELLWKLL